MICSCSIKKKKNEKKTKQKKLYSSSYKMFFALKIIIFPKVASVINIPCLPWR